MTFSGRQVTHEFAKVWKDNVEKEERLRLNWFRKNEDRLMANAEMHKVQVTEEMLKERVENEKQLFQEVQRQPKKVTSDPDPLDYDPNMLIQVMKPVDYATRQILYTAANKDGRERYLHERYKIIPEDRYYFPETTSFRYGWKMGDCAKKGEGGSRFGKSQIIKQTFYRRKGVEKDPEWYQEPVRASYNTCDCT